MKKYPLSDSERNILKVVKSDFDNTQGIPSLADTKDSLDQRIYESEALLRSLGYDEQVQRSAVSAHKAKLGSVAVRSFDDLLDEANRKFPNDIGFEDIFTESELAANAAYIRQLNAEFNAVHKLDKVDVLIPAVAGILSGAIDCVFGGLSEI